MLDPANFPSAIAFAFEAVGGIGAAAKACDRSYQALNKWRRASCLPRTDYTGETKYAALLADAANQQGNAFQSAWLLGASAPQKSGSLASKKTIQRPLSFPQPAPPQHCESQ